MTKQIKNTIKILEDAKIGIMRWDMTEWYDTAIRSLQAWEEVIEELEKLKSISNDMLDFDDEDMYFVGKKQAYKDAINIINQKLAEEGDLNGQ